MSLQGGDVSSPNDQEERKPRPSSAASSSPDTGGDGDSFEDAVDNADTTADTVDAGSVRSLTKRSVSLSKRASRRDGEDEENEGGEKSDRDDKDKKDEKDEEDEEDKRTSRDELVDSDKAEVKPAPGRTSSPLSRRISNTSNLDNVNLDDETPAKPEAPPIPPEKDHASKTLSLSSITNALPSMAWSPSAESPSKSPGPSNNAVAAPPPQPAPSPPARKRSAPFSWFSTNKDTSTSPPAQPSGRRNTASSIATLTSNPEMMLSTLTEENQVTNGANGNHRKSLKDRFKVLRMREEAGIQLIPGDGDGQEDALGLVSTDGKTVPGDKSPLPPVPSPNHELAPGTASGVNAGPSAMQEAQVDWDLWQSVVYEGPAAVARTSPEELNRAIATGIPNAIRGVIWQVLAQSKNEHLETLYKDLVTQGTDKDRQNIRSTATSPTPSASGIASYTNGDGVKSSASSIHSNKSAGNGSTSPRSEKSHEAIAKAQAASAAEKQKKQKERAAKIQTLEKTIRRDLGARTSFSKHAAAAGLQEGLFGVCKAYALYDDGVGYAQGMNFLIMPLLFNMPEDEAFCLLVRLMHQYKLRDLFIKDMPGLHMHCYLFERLLEDLEPALYCHLHRRDVSPHLYATQWFLTLFAYRFPLQLVLRIYDLILSEGLSAILRFGIVLMQKNASTLLGLSDMQQLTTYLKDRLFDVYIDKDPSQGSILENGFFGSSSSSIDKEVYRADQLVRDACEVKITPEILKIYTAEWEEKTQARKKQETELQDLKMAKENLAGQVRKLEERVQAHDAEQKDLCNKLVHCTVESDQLREEMETLRTENEELRTENEKLRKENEKLRDENDTLPGENDRLRDENEGLQGQVKELRNVIQLQPEEIERKWKIERSEMVKKNADVYQENVDLQNELHRLAKELADCKLRYAQINDEHETLKTKWTDMGRQFRT
ncbi:Rab GTPase-TBC domain protein [Metarhizium robertsii]|uniref:GTPase-activating protein GYP5 n=2 Tax=Metarhizium robertsii TaxID=568076 RepID=E9EPW6_METRA|nr:GTPase activating protein (Gyp5) [Metarhizium robertsii ARSEF 23]EFZ02272.1 GTPase activating protein (Gyp5) [Metarhizium robertsii ARSEF 23]EXV05447.1 Rab GTPase-TBC domain protein [Metarhizium robertsii]